MKETKRCRTCGWQPAGLETVCPACGASLASSGAAESETPQLKWSTDLIASLVALVATFMASGLLGLRFLGMFFFWLLMMGVLLGKRWRHLGAKQIAFRSLKLLPAIFALLIVVISVLWAGCALLLRGFH